MNPEAPQDQTTSKPDDSNTGSRSGGTAVKRWREQGCSPKKEVVGRLKQDLDKDLQLHRILILLY